MRFLFGILGVLLLLGGLAGMGAAASAVGQVLSGIVALIGALFLVGAALLSAIGAEAERIRRALGAPKR